MDNFISTMIFRFVGVQILIDLITDAPKEVQSLAAANLANMAKSSVGRNILKKHGGLQKLVRSGPGKTFRSKGLKPSQ